MAEEKDIRELVDEDIVYCRRAWEESSYDSDKMEGLFHMLLSRYMDKISGFSKGLRVIQPYDDTAERAETSRQNVRILLERLHGFRENGYSNDGLMEYYIRRERQELNMDADFTTVRLEIGMMDCLHKLERDEIIAHIDAMEEVCAQVVPKREKWESLREHLVWLSGKNVTVAMKILPLFFRIN